MKEAEEKPLVLFKVLRNMHSCSGGKLAWELGKRYTVKGKLVMCEKGFHLTGNPQKWVEKGGSVYFAEAYGVAGWSEDKCVCASVVLPKNQDPAGISEETLTDYQSKWDALYADYQSKRDALNADYKPKWDALNADYNSKWDALNADYRSKVLVIISELYRLQSRQARRKNC